MKFPKIIISYNRFLDPIFIGWIRSQPRWKDWEPPTKEIINENIQRYNEEWSKYEQAILTGMTDVLGMDFSRNTIEVHIVSGNPRPFSNPIVMKSTYEKDDFIDVLAHELIHCLFSDNKEKISSKDVQRLFLHDDVRVSNHVVVHAILSYLYIDVLSQSQNLQKNRDKKRNLEDVYATAWKIVDEVGYKNVIEKIKEELSLKKK